MQPGAQRRRFDRLYPAGDMGRPTHTSTSSDSAYSVAAAMGPWRIRDENSHPGNPSVAEIAAGWAAECEPDDDDARDAAERGALAGFDRYLAGAAT